MSSRRFALRLLVPALLVSATGCFALFPLDDYQRAADVIDSGPTQPPLSSQKDATVTEASTTPEDDDGGDPPVKPDGRVVFVSSTTYNGNLGGVAMADKLCQELATSAKLDGTFKAILSGSNSSEESMASRFGVGTADDRKGKGLVDVRSNAIASSYTKLLSEGPGDPIIYTEQRTPIFPSLFDAGSQSCAPTGGLVWTNTNSNGAIEGNDSCADWQSDGSGVQGRVGLAYVKQQWLSACAVSCNAKAHLYCGQP